MILQNNNLEDEEESWEFRSSVSEAQVGMIEIPTTARVPTLLR
jgi:hypothetical protein